jgi:hypothetical protein
MASGRKNYFRHSYTAHQHPAIAGLVDDHGKESYFHFFVLVELCAEQASDSFPDGGKFVFRRSTLCHHLLVTNSRLVRHLLAMCPSLVDDIVVTEKEIEILFPKLSKYMGKYETKIDSNTPNKRKEKEKKVKENKENKKEQKKDFESPLKTLFEPDHEIQTWLRGGLESAQARLLSDYDENYLRDVLVHCFEWQRENKKRSAGTFIEAWIKRDKNAKFKGGLTEHQKKLKDFFESQGIQGQEV